MEITINTQAVTVQSSPASEAAEDTQDAQLASLVELVEQLTARVEALEEGKVNTLK